jgi:hypothetical protein
MNPENNIRMISNSVKNPWRYLQVKVDHWYQQHRRQILPLVLLVSLIPVAHWCQRYWRHICVNATGGKFPSSVNDTGGNLPTRSMTPAVNLPLVSMTPVANKWNNIKLLTP